MVGALYRRETRSGIEIENDRPAQEQRRASLGYLIWPVAVYERIVDREPASSWFRFMVAQALAWGLFVSLVGLGALLWPLVISLIFPNAIGVLWIYGLALTIDVALFAVWLIQAVGYSKQASRGKMFEIARVAKWTRRLSGNR